MKPINPHDKQAINNINMEKTTQKHFYIISFSQSIFNNTFPLFQLKGYGHITELF